MGGDGCGCPSRRRRDRRGRARHHPHAPARAAARSPGLRPHGIHPPNAPRAVCPGDFSANTRRARLRSARPRAHAPPPHARAASTRLAAARPPRPAAPVCRTAGTGLRRARRDQGRNLAPDDAPRAAIWHARAHHCPPCVATTRARTALRPTARLTSRAWGCLRRLAVAARAQAEFCADGHAGITPAPTRDLPLSRASTTGASCAATSARATNGHRAHRASRLPVPLHAHAPHRGGDCSGNLSSFVFLVFFC